jgi:phospholipid/cholesterol/gamma-HCH transport system substrate-binding protein
MKREIKVGIFVVLGLVILAYLLTRSEKLPWVRERGYPLKTVFPTVAGLVEGAEVRVAGYHVGEVKQMQLTESGVEVTMFVREEVRIRRGARAAVGTIGLLGEKYVEITSGPIDAPYVGAGEIIYGQPPTSIDQVVSVLNSITSDVGDMVEHVRGLIASEESKKRWNAFLETFDHLNKLTMELSTTNKPKVDQMFDDAQAISADLREDVPQVVANLREFTFELKKMIEENRSEVRASVANMNKISARLDSLIATLDDLLKKINQGEGTVGELLMGEETKENVKETIADTRELVGRVKNTFGSLGKMDASFGVSSLYFAEDDGLRNYFTLELTSDNNFVRLQLIDDQIGRRYQSTELVTTIEGDGASSITTIERTKQERGFSFSALAGRRFGAFSLRGGLIESEIGAGADLLLGGRVLLSFDSFDFLRDEGPHLRLTTKVFPTRRFFLAGGYDDFWVRDYRQFFFGAGARF